MSATIESLTLSQLAAVYNYHAQPPVKKFENRQKGARRLLALLATIEVDPADAIAAVIPDLPQEGEKIDTATEVTADVAATAPLPEDERQAAETARAHAAGYEAGYAAGYAAGQVDAANARATAKPAKAPRAAAAPRTATAGAARALIIAACSRPEGATSAELYETTGWKFASWSHQLKLITAKTGTPHEIRKVDGTTRYFLNA